MTKKHLKTRKVEKKSVLLSSGDSRKGRGTFRCAKGTAAEE